MGWTPRPGSGPAEAGADGLSLLEVCDLSYTMQVERLERVALAERTALLSRPGMKFEDVPSVDAYLEAFDDYISSEPEQVHPQHADRLRSLGLM